jgi:hypothetical protein
VDRFDQCDRAFAEYRRQLRRFDRRLARIIEDGLIAEEAAAALVRAHARLTLAVAHVHVALATHGVGNFLALAEAEAKAQRRASPAAVVAELERGLAGGSPAMKCVHCKTNTGHPEQRHLCYGCFNSPVRSLYSADGVKVDSFPAAPSDDPRDDETPWDRRRRWRREGR